MGPIWIRQGEFRCRTASRGAVPRYQQAKTLDAESNNVIDARSRFAARAVSAKAA